MPLRNVLSVARAERMLLMRTTRFRVLGILGVAIPVGIGILLAVLESQGVELNSALGLSGFLPFYVFSYVQTIVIAFVAGNFRAADEQAHVAEVLAARPLSTTELVFGKYLGILQAMLTLTFTVMGLTLTIQAAKFSVTDQSFRIVPYLWYLGLMTLPALVFMSALTFFLGALLRHRMAVSLIAIGYAVGVLIFLGDHYGGVFDFGAFFAPLFYSDMIGLGDIDQLVVQRLMYTALGFGLLGLAVFRYPRLPQRSGWNWIGRGVAAAGIAATVLFGVRLYQLEVGDDLYRADLLATQIEWAGHPAPSVTHYEIDAQLAGRGAPLRATARMTVTNPGDAPLDLLVFSLNPGLELDAVRDGAGRDLEFERDGTVVRIRPAAKLAPGGETVIEAAYAGTIDRDGFDLLRTEPRVDDDWPFLKDDLTAWIRPTSAYLPPRSRWYPAAGVDYGHEEPPGSSFFTAVVSISTPAGIEIVTQGRPVDSREEDGRRRHRWEVDAPVPVLSLNAGRYETFSTSVEDVDLALLVHPAHSHQVTFFAEAAEQIEEALARIVDAMEQETGLPYPYPRLSVVEVPFQVQWYYEGWREVGGLTQPGVLMVEENVILDQNFQNSYARRARRSRGEIDPARTKRDLLLNGIFRTFLSTEGRRSGLFRSPLVQLWSYGRAFTGDNAALLERGLPIYMQEDVASDVRSEIFSRGRGRFARFRGRDGVVEVRAELGGLSRPRDVRGTDWNDVVQQLQQRSFAELDPSEDEELYRAVVDTKGLTFFRMVEAVLGNDQFVGAMGELAEASQFRNASFDQLERAVTDPSAAARERRAKAAASRRTRGARAGEAGDGDRPGAGAERRGEAVGGRQPGGRGRQGIPRAGRAAGGGRRLAGARRGPAGEGRGARSAGGLDDEPAVATGEDLEELVRDWLYGTSVPGYMLTRAEARKIDQGWGEVIYQVVVRVRNGEPGRGVVEVTLQGRQDEVGKAIEIDGGQEVEIAMTTWDRPFRVTVDPFFAKNQRALVAPLRVPEEAVQAEVTEYVRVVDPEEAAFTEIVVDNEDEGFLMPVLRERRFLRPELEGNNWRTWELPTAYGRYGNNLRWKQPGDGAQPAIWTAELPHAGAYDVFFYHPFARNDRYTRWLQRGLADELTLTVVHAGREEVVELDVDEMVLGWNFLGRFAFEAGETARVELTDLADGRLYADAVRWRWVDPENPPPMGNEPVDPAGLGGGRAGIRGGVRR